MAEPIEILFGLQTWVGPRNRLLDGGQDPPREGALLRRVSPLVKHCNSQLHNNICTLTVAKHDGNRLSTAIYRSGSLGDRYLHLRYDMVD